MTRQMFNDSKMTLKRLSLSIANFAIDKLLSLTALWQQLWSKKDGRPLKLAW